MNRAICLWLFQPQNGGFPNVSTTKQLQEKIQRNNSKAITKKSSYCFVFFFVFSLVFFFLEKYPAARYPSQGEERFSSLVREGVAGIVHTHSVAWKADIEAAMSGDARKCARVRGGGFVIFGGFSGGKVRWEGECWAGEVFFSFLVGGFLGGRGVMGKFPQADPWAPFAGREVPPPPRSRSFACLLAGRICERELQHFEQIPCKRMISILP